jgi:hypothetical protein
MITTELISANALRIVAPDKLKADDFLQIAPQIDARISQYGKIKLLIDAPGLMLNLLNRLLQNSKIRSRKVSM